MMAPLNYRFFEKLPPDSLAQVRESLLRVMDDRSRQFDLFSADAPTGNPPGIAVKASAPTLDHSIATLLSPSQLNCWLGCQARWMYKYLHQLPDTTGTALALGKALHAALAENFSQKIETKQDLPTAGVMALFTEAFSRELETATLAPEDDIEDLRDTGRAAVSVYMDQVASTIDPAAVELHVSGTIAGVQVQGYIDLLDVHGRILDFKTAKAKRPVSADYRRQITTYVQIAPAASGEARLDTLVKTKTVQMVQHSMTINAADRKAVEVLYPLAQEGMRAGLYMPNRGNDKLCSRKYCPFWQQCEADFGGEVKA